MKIVGIVMSVFGSTYTVFVVGRFFMGCGIGSFLPTYVLSKMSLVHTGAVLAPSPQGRAVGGPGVCESGRSPEAFCRKDCKVTGGQVHYKTGDILETVQD